MSLQEVSEEQQGAPTQTKPWTLFLGHKLQDGIAVSGFLIHFYTIEIFLKQACRVSLSCPGKRQYETENIDVRGLFSLLSRCWMIV